MNDTNWREDYLARKPGLKPLQIKLLKEGATQLSNAWILNAMHQDWKRLSGIPPEPEPPNCQSSFQEWNKEVSDEL